jgi:hypothetical protein
MNSGANASSVLPMTISISSRQEAADRPAHSIRRRPGFRNDWPAEERPPAEHGQRHEGHEQNAADDGLGSLPRETFVDRMLEQR